MPTEQHIDTSTAPTVTVERVTGRLAVRTWDEARVLMRSTGSDCRFNQEGDEVILYADGNTLVWLPAATTLRAVRLDSDFHVVGVQGPIKAERVAGNAAFEDVGAVTLGRVHGNLLVKQCSSAVTAETVSGNASVTDVAGDVHLGRCRGNLSTRGVGGAIQAEVSGNATLRLFPMPGGDVNIDARGNIKCRFPADAAAAVNAQAGGRVRLVGLAGATAQSANAAAFTLGEGGPRLNLQARGSIELRGVTSDEEIGIDINIDPELSQEIVERTSEAIEQIAEQLEAQMDALAQRLNEQFARFTDSDEIVSKVQEKVQRAIRRAEEKINQVTRHAAEREARRWDRRVRRGEEMGQRGQEFDPRRGDWRPPTPPTPPRPPRRRQPVTAEERLRILRMVEEGKLSVEQAEMLLAALNR